MSSSSSTSHHPTGDTILSSTHAHSHSMIILDGGTGREIERRGGPFRQPEWSAQALYDDPDLVREVHAGFLDAGATAVTTNTYAIVPFHIGQERYKTDGRRLLRLAVELARQAVVERQRDKGMLSSDADSEKFLIVGSLPPLFGSYEHEAFQEEGAGPMVGDFLNAFRGTVDVILLETVGSVREAKFYLRKIRDANLNLPVWVSFCIGSDYGKVQTPRLLSKESIEDALTELKPLQSEISAVLVNCCDVKLVSDCIRDLKRCLPSRIRVGAYPNAFSIPPPEAANHTLRLVDYNITPEIFRERAAEWKELGATILGGCCGIGPEHIAAVATLRERRSTTAASR